MQLCQDRLVLDESLAGSKRKSGCVSGVATNSNAGHLRCEAGFTLVAPLAQVGSGGSCGSSCRNSSLVGGTVLLLLFQTHQLPHFLCSTLQIVRHFIICLKSAVCSFSMKLDTFG